ncbi:hypothetical protein APA_681 [Pseudanabaena sp. lw0831]|uniref:CHAT domain-containing protein n=1 Tax=Pseudanabaena sp. lw0831 TaxID=1357935 RepID=UPI001916ACE5|nr:DUF2225 domain-containing protein [Pseudanabaena sp. lw0831]GBO52880.1 hypothetical protein APA_681 [Pseudanabaena sp. lw0831]
MTVLSCGQVQLVVCDAARSQSIQDRKAAAERLYKQGNQQYQANKYQEALQAWEQALQIYREIKDRKGEGNSLNGLGKAYDALEEYQKAIKFYEQSLLIMRELKNIAPLDESTTLFRIGHAYSILNQAEKATIFYEQALAIRTTINDLPHAYLREVIGELVLIYADLGQYQKIIAVYEQELAIVRQRKLLTEQVRVIYNLAQAYQFSRDYERSIVMYQQALVIARELKDREQERNLLDNLGNVYLKAGKYELAIAIFQQMLVSSRMSPDPTRQAIATISLGDGYRNLGQYTQAIKFYRQGLELSRKLIDRIAQAGILVKLGNAYLKLGKYEQAIALYQQSLAIARSIDHRDREGLLSNIARDRLYDSLGQDEIAIRFFAPRYYVILPEIQARMAEGIVLSNLGLAYERLGQFDKAIALYQQELAIAREIKDIAREGAVLSNLGNAYDSSQQFDKAIVMHQQALTIMQKIKDTASKGRVLVNLANTYRNLGQNEQAIEIYQQALAIAREIKNRDSEGTALRNLGVAYANRGQHQQALDIYQQAVTIAREIGDRDGEGTVLSNLGKLLAIKKQPELAILFYKQSINVRESIRKDIRGLSQAEQKSYLSTVETSYRDLADLLLKQDRILEAQQVLDLLKVQELSDYLRTVRGNDQTAQGVDLQRPEQNIIALAGELNQLQQKDREGKLNETEQQRLSQLVQAERDQNKQFNAFLDSPQIKKLITELRRNEDNQNVDIAKYRKLQKDLLSQFPNAVLLYPLILSDRLELVILNTKIPPLRRTVNIKREQLNQLIIALRADLQDSGSEDVKQTSQKLYDILIKPFESELNQLKINTIIYAPDGQLRYIPLASLYDGKQWLVEKYRVNNITAESLTAFNSKAIANPHIFAGAFGGKGGETRSGFNGLPASIPEVQKITSLFPNTTSLIEKDFTKKVTADRANSHTILHLATHGQLLVGTPEDSFIVFGNGEKVTIGELKDWDLKNVDLVVLSACQSGLGSKLGNGVEILGLGYQMQAAGARVAIASLWKVDDAGTQALMEAFYGELKKGDVPIAEALRKAQVSLIKSSNHNHPFYWSAFFAIGNGL